MAMEEDRVFRALVWFQLARSLLSLRSTKGVRLYGRHLAPAFSKMPSIPARLAWFLMEAPAVFLPLLVFARGRHRLDVTPRLLLFLFEAHYCHRAFIYPLRLSSNSTPMPALTTLLAAASNAINAYIQARCISHFGTYASSWLTTPYFIAGSTFFAAGMAINIWADGVLLSLRRNHDGKQQQPQRRYSIPRGGLYEYVSCPNYFGEALEWLGWAIATCSAAGLSFFLHTIATLAPRAAAHHKWYLDNFPSYPRTRKAMVPLIF